MSGGRVNVNQSLLDQLGVQMGNRLLYVEEFREMVEAMQDATHEIMGSLTVHTGTHPSMRKSLS